LQQPHHTTELLHLALCTALGLLVGWALGSIAAGLALAFFGYGCWMIHQLQQLDEWLQRGAKLATAPDTVGIVGNIEKLIFRRSSSNRERKARLKKIVGWYNQSAGALPDATVVTNDNYEVVWANEAAQTFLNIRGNRDSGQRIDNLVRDLEFQKYLTDKNEEEIEIRSPVNDQITLAVRRVAYAENMYLFSARDVSQRMQLAATRSAFVANASHELKTPLTIVSGYLELLSEDDSLPQNAKEKILIAEQNAKRMQSIVQDLLTLSRLENQRLDESKLTQVNLSEILRQLVNEIQATGLSEQHTLTLNVDDSLMIIGSESELKSLCSNLCYNAVTHTPANTQVTIEWIASANNTASLVISDNGQGIDPRHLSHLTERFYRVETKQDSDDSGTGLGLAIVKHIVSRHDAVLDISSTIGRGTSFCVVFPADKLRTEHHRQLSGNLPRSASTG